MKLIMTKGLPASGKSTWAKDQVFKSGGRIKRINKDDLREMLDSGLYTKENEQGILTSRNALIKTFLRKGIDVIVDDTNIHPMHENDLRTIAKIYGADFSIMSFMDIPVETCIERDLTREKTVGHKVIENMHKQYLKTLQSSIEEKEVEVIEIPEVKYDKDLENAIICDIDGTLAHMDGKRSPYDESKVFRDRVDNEIANILRVYTQLGIKIIIVSGRHDTCSMMTKGWLENNDIPYDSLLMRKGNDNRNDAIVKREIYEDYIKEKYNILFVLDDRDRVVKMWREQGLKCLQVAEGDF